MQPKLPKLPIGIQTFANVCEDGCIYVDKTEYLVDLIDNDYAKPYPDARILGLAIDGEKRQITEWSFDKLGEQ